MAMGRPKGLLVLDSEQREQLESFANSRSLPAGLVRRAKIILLSASGKTNREVARQVETSKVTVSLWRCRFLAHGVRGLYDELRSGRPRPISDERVAQLVRKTLKTKPKDGTHWSIRQIAVETGLSKSTVHRIWHAFGLQPHRQKQFKLSSDPFFCRTRAVGHVAGDQLRIDVLDPNPRTPSFQPAPPTLQPALRKRHRLRTDASCSILFDIRVDQPIPSPHRRPPTRQPQRPLARRTKRHRNKQYDPQYDFLGGRNEPRTELKNVCVL